MIDVRGLFMDYLKPDAVDWGDPDSDQYEWPLVDNAPDEAVSAYKYYVSMLKKAQREGKIIN